MFLLGRKVGMTQVVGANGRALPVTLVQAGPCRVLRVKSVAADGYDAVQLAFGDKPRRLATRAERGRVAGLGGDSGESSRVGGEPPRVVREGRGIVGLGVGDVVTVGVFEGKKFVDVVGVSKGRGYAGVMKRHNFSGLGAAHGVKKVHRSGGSVGQNTFPGRVFKGAKMAGHYGSARVTVRNLDLVSVNVEEGLLVIHGALPGPVGGVLVVRFPKEPPRSSL